MSGCATQTCKTASPPQTNLSPQQHVLGSKDFEERQSRQSVSISSELLQRTRCARTQTSTQPSPQRIQGHRNHRFRGWSFSDVLCHVCTQAPWLTHQGTSLEAQKVTYTASTPKPMQPLRELGMEHLQGSMGPFSSLSFQTLQWHTSTTRRKTAAGQDESQFCWFVLSFSICFYVVTGKKKKSDIYC